MKAFASDIVNRIQQQYSAGGIRSLTSKGIRFVSKEIWLETLTKRQYTPQKELQNIAERTGGIWYEDVEEPFEIPHIAHPELRSEFEPYPRSYSPCSAFVCELPNCILFSKDALGMTEKGQIISETTPYKPKDLAKRVSKSFDSFEEFSLLAYPTLKEIPKTDEVYFPLVDVDRGYYHWITEYLPKIRLLERYMEETDRKPTILIRPDPPEFATDSLDILGYGSDDYTEWDSTPTKVSRLVVPSHRSHRFNYYDPGESDYQLSKVDLSWLRNKMRGPIGNQNSVGGSDKIYISRQKTNVRKVINYKELEDVITDLGFTTYTFEDYSVKEQLKIVSHADTILSPHGAGLTNMVFSENSKIVELLPREFPKPHFYYISHIMGLEYTPVLEETRDGNLFVDTNRLQETLKLTIDA